MSRSKKSSQSSTGENDLETSISKESSKSLIKSGSKSDSPQSPLQSPTTNDEPNIVKPVERVRRRSSRVLEAVEKLDQIESMAKNNLDQKRRSSLGSGSSNSSKKSIESDGGSKAQTPTREPQFSLESTVGLNKLAESALNNEPISEVPKNEQNFKDLPDDLRKSLNAIRVNIFIKFSTKCLNIGYFFSLLIALIMFNSICNRFLQFLVKYFFYI